MIRVTDDGPVRVVTLDRPAARNALTPDGLDALERAVVDAPGTVVLVRGAGDAFCAGADLSVVAEVATDGDPQAFVERGQRVLTSIAEAEAAVVAGIDGAARGGGVELALACDLRVATPEATFAEPGVTFGLFGAWGGTHRLPETVGMADAMDISLTGRAVDAAEAHRMGLVSRVVGDPRTVADELAAADPSALRLLKERLRDDASVADQEAAEAAAFEALMAEHADELSGYRKG
ncbi:enoyl-CoA hydratase/isomerase family protein [Halorarius litoreus]|uniref:enoyl-CoA hydratase/isomerase family protein n=1 Tax=Halorarius litoreus TaxID=2962676 RepID=UPI0020CB6AAF|nr:enoyl-CoA hydratase/isomerase family protein [Halorarius litoreus]